MRRWIEKGCRLAHNVLLKLKINLQKIEMGVTELVYFFVIFFYKHLKLTFSVPFNRLLSRI